MWYFLSAFGLSVVFTFFVKKIAQKFNIVDRQAEDRKNKNKGPVPLLGGLGIFLSFWLVSGFLLYLRPIYEIDIFSHKMIGVFLAGCLLMIIGFLDDKKGLSPKWRLLFSAVAVLLVILGGVGLEKITNPFGGIINLNFGQIIVGHWGTIFVWADLLIFLWLLGMIYTVKISDGLDGLATGIVFIGALMIYFLTATVKYYQPNVGLLSLVFAGACLGFLVFNFYPAKIYLGEGGGLFLGLMLGVLAVIAGGKFATALLVMAIPIFDLARVMFFRIREKRPLFVGDREHIFFRILDYGVKEWQAVLLFYFIAFSFGITTLFLQSSQKFLALAILGFLMLILTVFWVKKQK